MAEFRQYSTKNKVTTQANFDSLDKSTLSIGEQYSIVGPLEKDDLSTDIQNSLTKADNAFVAPTNDSTATAGQVLTKTAEGSEWKDAVSGDVTAAGNNTFTGNNTFEKPIVINSDTAEISVGWGAAGMETKYSVAKIETIAMEDVKKTYTCNLPAKSGTFAMTDDIPDTSSFVTASGTNTFTGTNTFNSGLTSNLSIIVASGGSALNQTIYDNGVIHVRNSSLFTRSYNFPYGSGNPGQAESKTVATTDDIKITEATLDGTTLSLTLG